MSQTPQRKSVLITGCSAGGIGHALAKEYHAKGLRVFATARRPSTLDALRALGIECLELDVTSLPSLCAARDEVAARTGGTLDMLVNNAGTGHAAPAMDMDMDDVRGMFETNVFGVMLMVKEFVHLLIASGAGRIVNIGSVSGIIPYVFGSPYNATKAALHAYGNTLRVELAPFNVKIITIITGSVKSNISSPQHRRPLPPDSLYQPINDIFVNKRQGYSQYRATPTEEYARAVVASTLKSRPRALEWHAKNSWLVWFSTFFPYTWLDPVMSHMFGLAKLAGILKLQKKTV